jgi:hypothetical protein
MEWTMFFQIDLYLELATGVDNQENAQTTNVIYLSFSFIKADIAKGVRFFTIGTAISRVMGLARESVFTLYNTRVAGKR